MRFSSRGIKVLLSTLAGVVMAIATGSLVAAPIDTSSALMSIEGTVEVSPVGTVAWQPAETGRVLTPGDRLRTGRRSRATVRLADLSVFRVNELSTLQILNQETKERKPMLDLKSGSSYFFSREKPADVQIRTPVMAGAIRGTEFNLTVDTNGESRLTLIDGEVVLTNDQGQLVLKSGEEGQAV
ncbi:MAG: hypothetical protein QOF48_2216, partial [Verrucomicrobiota bacterium]